MNKLFLLLVLQQVGQSQIVDGTVQSKKATVNACRGSRFCLETRANPDPDPTTNSTIDAFGRVQVAEPQTIFESKMLHDAAPLFWDDAQTSGIGTSSTFNSNQASVTLAVSNLTAGTRVRQTFQRFPYQAGKAQQIAMTGILGAPATGITRRLGLFDGANGVFFESNGTTVQVVRRSSTSGSAVDAAVAQASWNVDKMNGTGPSGVTLDFSKTQIFVLQFQWLGVGSLWFGVNLSGVVYWVHRVDIANSSSVVSMSTPNLPLRYEISNSGSGGAASMLQICSTISSSGGVETVGPTRTVYRDVALTTGNTGDWYPLIAIRLDASYLDSLVTIRKATINCQSSSDYSWKLTLNPRLQVADGGSAFTFSALPFSAVDFDARTTSDYTLDGGVDIDSETTTQANNSGGASANEHPGSIRIGSSIDGGPDVLVLAVRRETGTTETFTATLTFVESR